MMADIELETIRHVLEVARAGGFSEVHLEEAGSAFSATLPPAPVRVAPKSFELNGASSETAADAGPKLSAIAATCVGYYRPSDGILRVGGKVNAGDIVATITALGLANDVEAGVSGEIVEILAAPEQAVEYGQPLVMVREE